MRSGRTSGTATILFTDLVGSTELMARLGDAAFDELRGEHFAQLRKALTDCGGEDVKNTGDGLLFTFASAVDALAGAVAVQQATDRHTRSAEAPIAVRVGLSLGEVAFEDGDVFGTPVVEAARLVAAARPGQILVTTVVKVVAGSRAEVEFSDLGALDLKGLPDPLPVCEVAWEPALTEPAAAVPLPSVVSGVGRIFVGRGDELARLGQCWKEVGAGERRLVLLGGEPGVGKTRLATALAQRLHAEGALVLAGRCDEDLGVPYQPFVEALRHHITHASAPRLGRHVGELSRLVPELTQLVPGLPEPLRSDPETERYRLFDAVAAWLGDVSSDTPVLLVLDDLQWAAKPTLLLLRHVLRSPALLRLLVVATYRDSDVGRGHPLAELLADVPRLPGAERLAVTGLDVPAVVTYLEEVAGYGLDEEGVELARAVWRETEGNAFFVVEVLRNLVESGALTERDGRWVLAGVVEYLGIPEGVRDVVGRRLSRLTEEANRVLAVASVVGLEFEPAVVQTAGGFSEDAVFAALEEAVAARLLAEVPGPVPRNRFAHALVRATLYEELSAARRVALHRKAAEAIESLHTRDLDDHLPALAHHYARASAPAADTAKAVDYARRAGDRALGQLAHDEAVGYYRQALELLEVADGDRAVTERIDLLISLGDAQRRSGDGTHREILLQAARLAEVTGDADRLARAALAAFRGKWTTTLAVDEGKVGLLEAALEASDRRDSTVRARLLSNLGVELAFASERDRPLTLTSEALAMARRLGDASTLGHVLLSRCAALISDPAVLHDSLASTAELVARAEDLHDPYLLGCGTFYRFGALVQAGQVREADAVLGDHERAAGEAGQPLFRWTAGLARTGRLLMAGRVADAEATAREALEVGLAGDQEAPQFFGSQRFGIRLEQGRLDEIIDGIVDAAEETGRPIARAMAVLACCEIDRDDEARRALNDFAPILTGIPRDVVWSTTMAQVAAACAHLGEASTAELILPLLTPFADQVVGTPALWLGSCSHYLGMLATTLGRFDDAAAHFAAAAALHDRIVAPTWLARTRLEWARALLTRDQPGDAEQARQLLGQALATARELGLVNVERRVVALLSQTP